MLDMDLAFDRLHVDFTKGVEDYSDVRASYKGKEYKFTLQDLLGRLGISE